MRPSRACAVARAALAGAPRAGLVASGELDLLAAEVGERVLGRADQEAAVADDLAGPDPGAVEFCCGLGQQPVLGRVARRVAGGQDEPARALARVLGHLADLRDIAELGRLAELALADRAGVGVGDRHQPVGDLQTAGATVDLLGDLAATRGELLELGGGAQLALGAGAARAGARLEES